MLLCVKEAKQHSSLNTCLALSTPLRCRTKKKTLHIAHIYKEMPFVLSYSFISAIALQTERANTMLFLTLILLLVCIGLIVYYLLLRQRYQYFSLRGIPTPSFQFFYGHLKTLWNAASYHRQLESWTKQYGKIYGIYEGSLPIFVVSAPDFLQEVFVKQFVVFLVFFSSLSFYIAFLFFFTIVFIYGFLL